MASRKKFVWVASLVLALGFAINYVDRGNISVAAPVIGKDFGYNPVQLGELFSAFFVAYAFMQIPAGFLAERLNLKWLYAVAFIVWSAATGATALAGSFLVLLLLRVFLSVGESISLPASSKILASEFREEERGIANGLLDSGTKFGPAIGTLLGGIILAKYGWRFLFLLTGGVALLWLVPWFAVSSSFGPPKPEKLDPKVVVDEVDAPELTLKQILLSRRAWATFAGNACGGYIWYLMLSWLPSYLVMSLHFNLTKMGVYGSLIFVATGLTDIAAGWASDRMIRSGWSASKVRIRMAAAGLIMSTLFVPAGFASTPGRAYFYLIIACALFGLYSANIWAITQSIAGPRNAGRWSGVQNFIGNLGGAASPVVTGWVIQLTGSFRGTFVITAVVVVVGAAIYLFLIRTLDPVIPVPQEAYGRKQVSI